MTPTDRVRALLERDPAALAAINETSYAEELRRTIAHWIDTAERWLPWLAPRARHTGPFDLLDLDGAVVVAGPPDAVVIGAAGLGPPHANSAAHARRAIDFMLAHGGELAAELSPYAHPDVFRALGAAGLWYEVGLTVLMADLRATTAPPDAETDPATDAGPITLEPLDKSPANRDELLDVAVALAEGHAHKDRHGRQLVGCLQWVARPDVRTVVARLGGRIAGVANAGLNDAGGPPLLHLYKTAVLPWARGRGVQRALMLDRVRWGIASGAELAAVDCEAGLPTERNARRLGFHTCYTKPVLLRESPPDPTTDARP